MPDLAPLPVISFQLAHEDFWFALNIKSWVSWRDCQNLFARGEYYYTFGSPNCMYQIAVAWIQLSSMEPIKHDHYTIVSCFIFYAIKWDIRPDRVAEWSTGGWNHLWLSRLQKAFLQIQFNSSAFQLKLFQQLSSNIEILNLVWRKIELKSIAFLTGCIFHFDDFFVKM